MSGNAGTTSVIGLKQDLWLIALAAVYWGFALLGPWNLFGLSGDAVYYIQNLSWLAFVLIHGSRRYGWDSLFVFFTVTFLISWSSEAASLARGLPFGSYHYTELLGPKAGAVPLAVMPAYFVAGYLAWTMATVFLGNMGTGMLRRNLFLVPVVASFITVMWDFCLDPIRSTVEGAWIWEDGGAYHGVPISNFFGWYLTMFLIFQVWALYLHRGTPDKRAEQSRTYWYLAPLLYLGLAVGFLLNPFYKTANVEIYWSVFLGCIFTMVFTSILNIIFVSRLDKECL